MNLMVLLITLKNVSVALESQKYYVMVTFRGLFYQKSLADSSITAHGIRLESVKTGQVKMFYTLNTRGRYKYVLNINESSDVALYSSNYDRNTTNQNLK